MFKRKVAALLSGMMVLSMALGGCGNSKSDSKDTGKREDEKPTVTLMIEVGGYTPLEKAVEMVKEKFPEYNIVSKEWSVDGVKRAIKTTYASGGDESIDIAFNSATGILGFAEADMLLDLTPYMEEDAEWSGRLQESALSACLYDGKTYGIPWQTAYPVLVANMDIFDSLGIEVKDDWTFDEFMEVSEKLKQNGYFSLGISSGYSAWIMRQSYLNGFETEEELDAFNKGEVPITDPKVKEAFDRAIAPYEAGYCYPGDGAIAATDDECKAGFANGKVALGVTTNGGAGTLVNDTGITNYKIVNFPSFSNYSTANLLGSPDVYIVPANAKNQDAVIDVLKYLTGEEVLTAMANIGTVVPLKDVETDDPNYKEYSKDVGRLHSEDFGNLSDEIGDYISTGSAMTNYLFEGENALDELEQMRKAVEKN